MKCWLAPFATLLLCCLVSCTSLSTPPPTAHAVLVPTILSTDAPPSIQQPTIALVSNTAVPTDIAMYQAVIDQFFLPGNHLETLRASDAFTQTVVYIDSQFGTDTREQLPQPIRAMLERSIKQLHLTPVSFPHPGGITLAISQAQLEPNAPKSKGQTGLAVFVYSAIEGSACGTGLSVGYAVAQTLNGWTAEPYTYAMC